MTISTADWQHACALIRATARTHMAGAGRVAAEHKADGSWVTAVDHAMQDALRRGLQAAFPAIGFLGEEMSDAEQASAWEDCIAGRRALWVVDPLDGTSNFRSGFPVYSVTLALMVDGVARFGAVYDPVRDELFSAVRGAGVWLNERPLDLRQSRPMPLDRALAAVDFKRLPADLACALAARPPFASQRSIGSVALDWCWLAMGRIQVYVHGKQKLWDYGAAQLILHEAGGVSARLDGTPDIPGASLALAPRSAVAATHAELLVRWQDVLGTQDTPVNG